MYVLHLCIIFSVGTEVNARRIQGVENCFGSSGQPLVVPGRVLVGEGLSDHESFFIYFGMFPEHAGLGMHTLL